MDSDQVKIFVGGISLETTQEKLRDHFSAFGQVMEVVIMKDRATGRGRGFGFIIFAEPVISDMVFQQKHNIDGRMVEAKKAEPREEQHGGTDRNGNTSGSGSSPMLSYPTQTKKIFVGGLPSAVTEVDFRSYFEQFGPITDVVVMYDHGTQRPRGFGFITYESEVSVERVLRKTFHDLKDKRVEVKRAVPKDATTLSGLNQSTSRAVGPGGARSTTSSYGGGIYAQAFNPISRYNMRSDTNVSSSSSSSSPVGRIDHAAAYRPVGYGNRSPSSSGLYNEAAYRVSPNGSSAYGSIGGDTVPCNAYSSYISGDTVSSNAYPGRNAWSIDGRSYGSSFASSAGYQASATLSNHGGFGIWTPPQPSDTRNSVAYNDRSYYRFRDGGNASLVDSASFSYAAQDGGYGPFPGGDRSAAAGGNDSFLFGGIHSFTSSGYSASTWQRSADAFDSSSTAFGGIFGTRSSFARDDDGGDTPAVDDGYGVQGRHSYRGVAV